jgi:DNA processing protein
MLTEAQSYHALNVALGANYEALKKLWEKYGSWQRAWETEKRQYPALKNDSELTDCELILQQNPAYPAMLKEIDWAPFGIYVQGQLPEKPAIAIVGTRRATANGKAIAKKLAQELSRQNAIIISGLAMGIDTAAHEGALEAGGRTIAVLPTGLSRIYPAQNGQLAEKILNSGGALISEYPNDYPSYASNFVHRNRIVSGLSAAVIIIEAPEKSGALITARFALEQNREVMVVPGPANHPNYAGSHKLIRDGAKLVTSAKEILEELNWSYKETAPIPESQKISNEEKIILEAIKTTGWPAAIDKIFQITKIEIPKINQIITHLILKGILKE